MNLIAHLADFMKAKKLTLTTAESCTAGLIASHLADVPGAGSLLDCAFITYSCEAKVQCLDVREETIRRFGLTSEAVAREMALGALARSRANLSIANTGVAEDVDDGTPAGTQCFAWAFDNGHAGEVAVFAETRRFPGSRNEVRSAGADYALLRIPHYFNQLTDRPDSR